MTATEPATRPISTSGADPSARARGLAFGLVSAAAFGLSGSFGHSLLAIGWSPTALVAARVGIAFLVLAVPCALVLRRTGLPTPRQCGRIVVYGATAVAGTQLFYFSALQHLSVGVALLVEYLAPVALIGWRWVRGTRPNAPVLAGAGLALVGLALVLDVRHGLSVSGVGLAYALAAMLCLAAYFVLSDGGPDEQPIPPLVLLTGGTGVGTVVLVVVGATGLLPFAAGLRTTVLGGVGLPWWVPLAVIGLVSAAFAYLSGIAAVRRLGSTVASFVALTELLFAVVFAVVLLDQVPTGIQVVGGLLVLAGVVVVQAGPGTRGTLSPTAVGRVVGRFGGRRRRSTISR